MTTQYTEDHEWIRVDADYAAIGTEVFAMVRGKGVPMVVSAMPFLPPRYHRG